MGKKAHLDITESASELKRLLVKQKSLKAEKRIQCLIDIKSNKFETENTTQWALFYYILTSN